LFSRLFQHSLGSIDVIRFVDIDALALVPKSSDCLAAVDEPG